ncbi:hypothetical protein Salat_1843200 [Sesamum alatum]|uniref:Uncharacterized protein n=1 Tax=Sesamum alatum TaxID=300844 RepID=A0AAE1Y3H8_9LAMI|nr:hypothetical protein Salat_1843200 [Sesamum alatum]
MVGASAADFRRLSELWPSISGIVPRGGKVARDYGAPASQWIRRLSLKPRSLSLRLRVECGVFFSTFCKIIIIKYWYSKNPKAFRFLLRRGVAGKTGRRSVYINSEEKPAMV